MLYWYFTILISAQNAEVTIFSVSSFSKVTTSSIELNLVFLERFEVIFGTFSAFFLHLKHSDDHNNFMHFFEPKQYIKIAIMSNKTTPKMNSNKRWTKESIPSATFRKILPTFDVSIDFDSLFALTNQSPNGSATFSISCNCFNKSYPSVRIFACSSFSLTYSFKKLSFLKFLSDVFWTWYVFPILKIVIGPFRSIWI